MAYIVVVYKDEEVDRFELLAPVTVGRAPDCEVQVRDIELSRHHCRVQPVPGGPDGRWLVVDLESKNGTIHEGKRVLRYELADNDVIRIGRTRLKFHTGPFDASARKPARHRPADPGELLSATVSGMTLTDAPAEAEALPPTKPLPDNAPQPKPKPTEPASYARRDVYALVTDLHASSWDSIHAGAAGQQSPPPAASDGRAGDQPAVAPVPSPAPPVDGPAGVGSPTPGNGLGISPGLSDPRRHRRPATPVDLALQAVPHTDLPSATAADGGGPGPAPTGARSPGIFRRLWRRLLNPFRRAPSATGDISNIVAR